jgi:GTP cyclohydrolase I
MIGERPTKQQAEEAVRTLLRYIGEDTKPRRNARLLQLG